MAILGGVIGCQSNSDRDLIARERRLQEDQIYALQDYVTQYQRLLCQVRQENNALRRQLAEGTTDRPEPYEPQLPSRLRNGGGAAPTAPKFQTPNPPGVRQQPQQEAPPPEVDDPSVPPLKSAEAEAGAPVVLAAQHEVAQPSDTAPRVLQASYDDVPRSPSSVSEDRVPARRRVERRGSEHGVLLRGEVLENEDGGGPRLVVEVRPANVGGPDEMFAGSASIMLLKTRQEGQPQNLGRWDFGPGEVTAAMNEQSNGPVMRFFIELPPSTPTEGPVELWVRLVPREGSKQLAHAEVDLTRPSDFSTQSSPEEVAAAVIEDADGTQLPPPTENDIAMLMESPAPPADASEGDWAVALPGRPVNLPPASAGDATGGWRATDEPIPTASASSAFAVSDVRSTRVGRDRERRKDASLPQSAKSTSKLPGWSPERRYGSSRDIASRRSWSPTR